MNKAERVRANKVFWSSRTLKRKKKKEPSSKNKTNGTENRFIRSIRVRKITKLHTHINNIEHGLPLERIILKCLLLMNRRFFMFTDV